MTWTDITPPMHVKDSILRRGRQTMKLKICEEKNYHILRLAVNGQNLVYSMS